MCSKKYTKQIIDSRYRIEEIIGEGGMGAVYLGEHIRMGKKVAIKFLRTEFYDDDNIVKRFFREAQVAATLRHTNIIDVLDVGISENDEPYLVMEYLEGESLATLIKRTGSIELSAAIGVMEPILNALANAHEVGVIHRDLKPENIFLVQPIKGAPLVKLIDFGISKLMNKANDHSRLTSERALLGTPMFMSPEQIRGEELDHRSDLYGAGVILYMMLTGNLPFNADTYPLLFVKILTDNPTPPTETLPDFPLEIEPIIMKLLCKEPAERYQSADDVLADLKELSQYSSRQEGLTAYTAGVAKKSIAFGDLGNPISRIQGIDTGISKRYQRNRESKADLATTRANSHFDDIMHEWAASEKTLDETVIDLPDPAERKELEALLKRVREFWVDGLLKRNTDLLGIIPQPKQLRDDLVAVPWEHAGRTTQRTESLDPSQSLTKTYKRLQRRLLILGEGGQGKTINLLRILKCACDEAENHDLFEHPIPVLFTLSSWHPGKGTLFDWMVEELAIKYVIPRKYGKRWLEQRFILPFLDGLNEMQPKSMTACIQAINAFNHRYTPRGLVVSSRQQEYTSCGIKLKLNGAILIESVAPETISDIIHSNRWRHLGEAVKDAPELEEMLRVPLILQIACEVVDDNTEFFKTGTLSSELSDTIFKRYIDLNLRNKKQDRYDEYASKQTGKALNQLARGMLRTGDTVFLFETLQPKWLRGRSTSIAYAILSRMIVALMVGLSIILGTGLSPLNNAGFKTSLVFGTQLGMASALIIGLGYGVRAAFRMNTSRNSPTSKKKISLLFFLLFAFICGLSIGGILYSIHRHVVVLLMGVQAAMICGAVLGLYRRDRSVLDADIVPVEAISWHPSGLKSRRFLGVLIAGFVSAVVATSVENDFKSGFSCFLAIALIGVAIQGFIKGRRSKKAIPNVGVVQSLKNAIVTGVVGLVLTTILFGYSYGIFYGACVGIASATFISLWFGGMEVVNHMTLRLLLALEGTLGLFIKKRLGDAVSESMLRQVGGGYMFEHETLIKHFAEAPNVITKS